MSGTTVGSDARAALSDTQTGTAGEGWLPPEVAKLAKEALELRRCGRDDCLRLACVKLRAALDALRRE